MIKFSCKLISCFDGRVPEPPQNVTYEELKEECTHRFLNTRYRRCKYLKEKVIELGPETIV
jgi:hypothetical protein